MTISVDKRVPKLRHGDRLTVKEYLRRYEAMPHVKKAELINGIVHMPSPVTHSDHGLPHALIMTWLGAYWTRTRGVELSDNTTVLLDEGENVPQPDALLHILPGHGGQSRRKGKYIASAPELVVEIAASSVGSDLYEKLRVYEANGVREYIVWRVEEEIIDWFVLRRNRFRRMRRTAGGLLQSRTFPGLWLDTLAALRHDVVNVVETLQLGLASDEHRRFVEKLGRPK